MSLVAVNLSETKDRIETLPLTVRIIVNNMTEEIHPWHDTDGKWYFFIPSYANTENIFLCAEKSGCYLQNTQVNSKEIFGTVEFGKEYQLVEHSDMYDKRETIIFLKSQNISTMYINTASGDMEAIYSNKSYKEPVSIRMYGATGGVEYKSNDRDTMKGHGNSTWALEKKPFKITTSKKTSFLGMEPSKEWILLANGYDFSNLRNKLVYDFASSVNMGWVPDCEYVDLYLNGEYSGLYLMTQTIDAHSLDADYLFCQSYRDRWGSLSNPILTDSGRTIETKYPENADEAQIQSYFQKIEALINHSDVSGEWIKYIDVETWAKKYLIEEIFANPDFASLHFYKDKSNKLFSGPCWDYDNALGNTAMFGKNYAIFPANRIITGQLRKKDTEIGTWYSILYHNSNEFREKFFSIYREEFLPILNTLLEETIDKESEKIEYAAQMNLVRWKQLSEKYNLEVNTSAYIKRYLAERVSFLSELWLNGTQYHNVVLDCGNGSNYFLYSIKDGETMSPPDAVVLNIKDFEYWEDYGSGEQYDFTQPITRDVFLHAVTIKNGDSINKDEEVPKTMNSINAQSCIKKWVISNKVLVVLLCSLAIMSFIGVILLSVDFKRNRCGGTDGAA